jgi:hypothetical protein
VPGGAGGRRRQGARAAAGRVAGIESGCVSGASRSRRRSSRQRRSPARVSAQPRLLKNLPVPDPAVTNCLSQGGVRRISGSVRACAVKLYGASCSARQDGGDGGKGGRRLVVGFRLGGRKYVAEYCRPRPGGPIVVQRRAHPGAAISPRRIVRGADHRCAAVSAWWKGDGRLD